MLYGVEIGAFGWSCQTLYIKMAYGCFATHDISTKNTHSDTNDDNTICVVDRLISDRQVIN